MGCKDLSAITMATKHRIFISFAIEDQFLRTALVQQGRDERSPFSFVDMSVKEPWDSAWKTNCRTKIKGCDGLIAIITKNTAAATGQLWEIACAQEEGIPVYLIYGSTDNRPTTLPSAISGRVVHVWTWANIKSFLDKL